MAHERLTNNANIDLSAAVWLAHDGYDYQVEPNYISVTTLIKPLRQTILAQRVPAEYRIADLVDLVQSRVGQSLHSGVETAWKEHYRASLARLGYPARVIDAVRINPEHQEPDTIPVYTEVRTKKNFGGYVVGGQIDLIIDFRLRDVKKTSVWGYMAQKGVGQWRLQGSLYRWLNPEKIHHDEFLIQYLLLDWSRAVAKRDPNYPAHPVPNRVINLMTVVETEKWVEERLRLLTQLKDAPEDALPECSEEDLWRTEPVYKYYASGQVTARSTKNFEGANASLEASQYKAEKGKGIVVRVPGQVKACVYCPAFGICTQKDRYIADGSLSLE